MIYQLPIHHVVVYLGERRPNIPTRLKPEEVFAGFELIDFGRLDYGQLLSSQAPEKERIVVTRGWKKGLALEERSPSLPPQPSRFPKPGSARLLCRRPAGFAEARQQPGTKT